MWNDKVIERPTIIAIHGAKRHGKDSIGDVLAELGYDKRAFAEPVYRGLLALNPIITFHRGIDAYGNNVPVLVKLQEIIKKLGWEKAKDLYPEVRELLQKYGTEAGRDIHGQDCWMKLFKESLTNPHKKYYVSDLRFFDELEVLQSMDINLTTWKVFRPDFDSSDSHRSEAGLPDNLFDKIFINDSTLESLQDQVRALLA